MNLLNKVGAGNSSSNDVTPHNSIRVFKEKKQNISILNFSRQSQNVIFTEPATIEAIKRLGFEMSEFNFIPLESFDSKTSDSDLTEKFYQRYLAKRQKMIEQTIKMRASIIDEQKYPIPVSPVVRRELMCLKKQQEQLEQIDDKSNFAFRKLALNRLHDLLRYQNDLDQNQRTTDKFRDIDEVNAVTSQFIADIRSNENEKPRNYFLPNINEYNYKPTPPQNSFRKQPNVAPTNMKETRASQFQKIRSAHFQREERTNIVNERKALIDQKNHEFYTRKIQEKEERFKISSAAYKDAFNDHLRSKRKMLKSRAKSAKIRKEELIQKQMDDTYESYKNSQMKAEQRLIEINHQKACNAAIRKHRDEEKTEKIKHSYSAKNYENEMKRKQIKEDNFGIKKIEEEEKMVKTEKTGANLRISQKRARLNKAFDQLRGIDDYNGLNKIQKIMELNDNQMDELVTTAYSIDRRTPHNRKTDVLPL